MKSGGSTQLQSAGKVYVYNVDEGMHSAIHRWRVDGLETIQDQLMAMKF